MKDFTNQRVQHLEFIQDVINRQAQNSFTVKGWSLTLSAGIFTFLLTRDANLNVHPSAYFIALLPVGLFWFLDAYYLWQERLFRCLYDEVRLDLVKQVSDTFSVDLFDMSTKSYRPTHRFRAALFSRTVCGVPFMLFVASAALFVIDNLT